MLEVISDPSSTVMYRRLDDLGASLSLAMYVVKPAQSQQGLSVEWAKERYDRGFNHLELCCACMKIAKTLLKWQCVQHPCHHLTGYDPATVTMCKP